MSSHEAEAQAIWDAATSADMLGDGDPVKIIATALASQSSQLSALSDALEKVKADIETFWKPQFNEQVERAEHAEAALAGARKALEKASADFESIRKILINHFDEPVRQAFWVAVAGRDAARRALTGGQEE